MYAAHAPPFEVFLEEEEEKIFFHFVSASVLSKKPCDEYNYIQNLICLTGYIFLWKHMFQGAKTLPIELT